MDRNWKCIESKSHGEYRIFQLREDICVSPRTGQPHSFFVLDSRDWVNVVPVTSDGQLVCIRQWRPGTRKLELEIPGGIVDPNESPEVAAARELREETGYSATTLIPLGSMAPNPAILNNRCYFFAAFDVRPTHTQALDEGEAITVSLVEVEDVPQLIREGMIQNGVIVAALSYFMLHQQTV